MDQYPANGATSPTSARNGAQHSTAPNGHLTPESVRAACRCANSNCDCHRSGGNVHCPAHDDTNGSLSVDERNGKTVWKCHAGCTQDAVFRALRHSPASAPKAAKSPKSSKGEPIENLFFDYTDEDGVLLFRVNRKKYVDGSKDFPTSRPDGSGGWIYKGALDGVRRVLWLLPEVQKTGAVFICEGEKAAARLNAELAKTQYKGVATTNAGGAGKWRDDYNPSLDKKHIFILPDNDDAGAKHGAAVCASIFERGQMKELKRVDLPNLPPKGDVCDFFDAGSTVAQLLDAVNATPTWTPSAAPRKSEEAQNDFPLDEIGNGKRFAAMFGHELRFCGVRDQWQVFEGGRWTPDAQGIAEQYAKQLAQEVATEAARQRDDDRRARLLKHALTLTKRKSRETMLRDAASEPGIMVSPELFDAQPEVFNCENGTLDLRTFEFRPHRADDFLTHQTSVVFDAGAECPTWRACVAQWMPREGVADYAQDSAGLSLTGRIYEEFFNLLIGPGDNGKTTFLRTLEQLAGDYWHKTEAETIMLSRDGRKAEAPAPALLALKGARLVTVHELDSKHKLNAALIKDLTGRDTISARGLFEKRPTNFLPQFTLWAFGNSKPQIGDDSRGMWRRVRIIDFDQVIPPSQRDTHLKTKLEAELSGILNWALDGLRRVQSRGLIVPDAVNVATDTYRAEQDPLAGFLSDCCTIHAHATANAGELFTAWCAWCRENEEKDGTNKAFATALKSKGFENYRGSDGRRWRGVTTVATVAFDGCSDKGSTDASSRRDFIGKSDGSDGCDGASDDEVAGVDFE